MLLLLALLAHVPALIAIATGRRHALPVRGALAVGVEALLLALAVPRFGFTTQAVALAAGVTAMLVAAVEGEPPPGPAPRWPSSLARALARQLVEELDLAEAFRWSVDAGEVDTEVGFCGWLERAAVPESRRVCVLALARDWRSTRSGPRSVPRPSAGRVPIDPPPPTV